MRTLNLVALVLLLSACANSDTQLVFIEGIGEMPFEPNCVDYESRRSDAIGTAAKTVTSDATLIAYEKSGEQALVFTESTHPAHPSILEIELAGDGGVMYTLSCAADIEVCKAFFAEIPDRSESWLANMAGSNAHGT